MKKITGLCLFALIGMSNTAHAELTRSQITDQNELRILGVEGQRMSKDIEENKEELSAPWEIGVSTEHKSDASSTLSVPFSWTDKGKGESSVIFSCGYIKEFNNGIITKQGLDDVSLKISDSHHLAKYLNITGISFNAALTTPMSPVGSGIGTQSVGVGYKHIIKSNNLDLQPIVKVTHYDQSNLGEDSLSKNLSMQLSNKNAGWSTSLSRKIRAGDAGLTKFDLGYERKSEYTLFNMSPSYKIGYSDTLTGIRVSTVNVEVKVAF